jgi:stearoyl-CoA desaturase (delta-9 desaturase)
MTWATVLTFRDHVKLARKASIKEGNYPQWRFLDRVGSSVLSRLLFGAAYTWFYIEFVPAGMWWLFLLLPLHFLMGSIHGAIVNWCGHKYGYSNFDNNDHSKNTTPIDILMLGELFQNNHHRFPNSADFGHKWFEFDPIFPVLRLMHTLRIIRIRKAV